MPFDIKSYLEDRNIPFQTQGKNVSAGWIELHCPFPLCGDPSFHLGVNLESTLFSCWHCGAKGDILKLIMQLESCSFQRAKEIEGEFQSYQIKELKREIQKRHNLGEDLLEKFRIIKPQDADCFDYLRRRGFDPQSLVVKYDLRKPSPFNIGDWKFRIIIPVYMDHKVVNFTSRDITGKAQAKYRHCSNEEAIVPMKQCLYNLDSIHRTTLIVEGVFDVWRMGPGTVATLGTEFTTHQIRLLRDRKLDKAVVMYDSDATDKAVDLASQLSIFIPHVKVVSLDEGDPADLSDEDAERIRRKVFG